MRDHEIIELYWARNESAITATAEKYGNYCHIMAGYTQFATLPENDEDYLVYIYQPEEHEDFAKFYKRFSGK